MALQAETQGQVTEFIRVLRKKALQVLLVAAFVATLGGAFSVFLPRTFAVKTEIELREARVEKDAELRDSRRSAPTSEILSASYHLKNLKRIEDTVRRLEWEDFMLLTDPLDIRRYTQTIKSNLDVEVRDKARNEGSTFLVVEYADVDSDRAVEFVESLTRFFIEDILAIDANRLQEELSLAQNHREQVIQLYENIIQKRKEILQELEVPDAPPRSGTRVDDPVYSELVRVSSLAEQLREQLSQDEGEMSVLRETLVNKPREIAVTKQEGGFSLEAQIATWEAEIDGWKIQLEKYRPGHSQYANIQQLIELNLQRIEDARARSRDPKLRTDFVPNPDRIRMEEIVQSLEARMNGKRVLLEQAEINKADLSLKMKERLELTAQLELVETEMITSQEARADAERDYTRKKLALDQLKEATESPFAVVEPAQAPINPSGLPTLLVIGVSAIGGIGLGLAIALLGEFTKNCYRSMHDVTRVMSVPVLGVINTITTRAEIRRTRTRHAIIGALSLIVMGVVGWFAWAYSQRPELLGTEIVAALKDFELRLR